MMVGRLARKLKRLVRGSGPQTTNNEGSKQALDLYWDPEMAEVLETWGYGKKHARRGGISALFAGPPGTGKTMAAEIGRAHV